MSSSRGRIDVHHHFVPPAFVRAMEKNGRTHVAGAPLPRWTSDRSLGVMDANGIRTAILSLSAPGVFFGDVQEARDLARACNDHAAETRAANPGRFGSFAVLPMPFTAPACAEAVYALDALHADGVVLLGSTEGRFLGDPAYEDLMVELDARGAVVFVHPNLHATSQQLGLGAPGFLVEFLCDTTRAAVNLILTGTVERYPRIQWILAHAGGFLPYIAWRVSLANALPGVRNAAPQGVLTYLRRFHFDTALSPSPCSMAALEQLVEPSHILFGSDYPFAPAPLVALECRTLEESAVWPESVKEGIDRGHALTLFPRFANKDETVPVPPSYRREPSGHRLARIVAKPAAALVQWVRNR